MAASPSSHSAARQRPRGSLGPRDDGGRARLKPQLKPRRTGLQRGGRCREFTNTNGNQGSWRRGGAGRRWRACAQDAALGELRREAGT